jgi:ribonucleoside-triphosphate reductase (formate)
LDMLAGYCAGWSLRTLLLEGLNGVPGKVEAGPPKHLSSAVGQIVNFLGTLQNEWAGAQAFSSFDTYMAPFIRKDNLSYDEVRQSIQELVYNLNVPSRWGTQTPFTNLTFDWTCPEDLRDQIPVIGGQTMPFTYGDLQPEMDMINRAYIEVMTAGDAKGRVFTFPIPTYNITPDFPWESENSERLFEMTAKYGLPYFQNFLNSDLKPNMVRSMCCRLQLDLTELLKRGNGLFGSAEQTGSVGVVTLNCARLGYLYRGDEAALFIRLDELLEIARTSLEIKRKVIQRHMDNGLFPYTKRYLGTLRNFFSTIGVNGINEMIRNFTSDNDDITSELGHAFAMRFLDHVRDHIVKFQEETGHMYNLEATPAEGTTYRFAREDRKRFPDILQAGTEDEPYYTNSSQLPVGFTDDPFEALERQDDLQRKYTGGTVLHLYMGERISSAIACKKLVRRALENFRLPYITITPTFSICPKHGYLNGEHTYCPKCDAEQIARKQLVAQS